jgi:hypothetical protein
MPCQMPLACFILSDRRRKDAGPSVRRDSHPLFVDLCLKAHPTRTRHNQREQDFIMTTEQGVHQVWTGQANRPKALQYF